MIMVNAKTLCNSGWIVAAKTPECSELSKAKLLCIIQLVFDQSNTVLFPLSKVNVDCVKQQAFFQSDSFMQTICNNVETKGQEQVLQRQMFSCLPRRMPM